jgi:hypothetical protein
MQSLQLLLSRRGLAAALIGATLVAPALGTIAQPNLAGTPDDGLICRTGYTGAFSGNAFKCSKTLVVQVNLHCPDPKIPNYVVRAAGAWGSAAGIDICTRNNVNVGSTDTVQGLAIGQDYMYAVANTDRATAATARAKDAEVAALGLSAGEVDVVAAAPRIVPSAKGSQDMADVTLTFYTFAIPTGGLVTARR